ncbi:MAG: hypothetical protein ACOC22_01810 [bacterium]
MAKSKLIKKFLSVFVFLQALALTFAVKVTETNAQAPAPKVSIASQIIVFLLVGFGIFLVIALIIIGIVFVLLKIHDKLENASREKEDFFYSDFLCDVKQCNMFKDSELKKRNWKRFWIFFKRNNVFVNPEKENFKVVGQYDGESIKTFHGESWVQIALYNKLGFLKFTRSIILVPFQMRHTIKKQYFGKKKELIIQCEGLDRVGNTDYLYMPLWKDKDGDFLDFADKIHNTYLEPKLYRDMIPQNLMSFKDSVDKAIKMNPNMNWKQKNPEN